MSNSSRQSLAGGTTVLLLTNAVNRIVDFGYRIYLIRLVGAEVIGAFQVVMPIYSLLLILGTAGIPPAVATLVAERRTRGELAGIERLMRLSLWLTALLGAAAACLMMIGAGPLTDRVLGDPRLYLMLLAIAPALLAVAVSSVYRGYFQGHQLIWPISAAQLGEQAVTLTVTLSLLAFLRPLGMGLTLAGLGAGITLGELVGLVILMTLYRRLRRDRVRPLPWRKDPNREEQQPETVDIQAVFSLAWPTTLTRLLGSASMMISALLVPGRLMASGHDRHVATALYGELTGMASAIVAFPLLLTFALAYNLMPAISAAYARKDPQRLSSLLRRSLLIVLVVSLPAAAVLSLLAAPLTSLAFGTRGPALSLLVLAAASPFLHVEQVMTGVLQGLSKPLVALRNFAFGEGLSLLLVYLLVPSFGIAGAALAWGAGFLAEAVLDFTSVRRILDIPVDLVSIALRPVLAVLPAAAVLALLGPGPLAVGYNPVTTVVLALFSLVLYAAGLIALGVTPAALRP